MPSKTEEYLALAQRTANGLTRYWESWTDYLTIASRLYKYPFADQLMIYAQCLDATACADFDIWNNRMNRYVRRGAKGIALLDESSGFPRLHYVFDVSDTGVRRNSRDPEVWQYNDDLKQPVSEMLAAYGISGERVSQQLADVAGKLVADYWDNNGGDIRAIVDGSLLINEYRRGAFPVGRHPRRIFCFIQQLYGAMRLLPVYFPHDLSACCGGQKLAQKAQEFILCTGDINDCRVLFLHNTGDVPSNACRVHAVLLVMLHLTDAPGDASTVFFIAENAFLTCLCKSGADVTQFYDGNMDAVGFDFVCQCIGVRRNGSLACRVESLERNVRYGGNGADVHNMPLSLTAQEWENRFVYSDGSEKVHIKLCFGLLHGCKLHRTGNAKACTVDHCIDFSLFLDDLLHSGVDRIFIGHIDRQMGDTLHRDTSAAELIDDAAVLFQGGCRAPSDAGASSGNNDDLVVFSHHDFPPENVDLVRVYRIARRLSIRIAGSWKSTGINLRKILRGLDSLFTQPVPISA